VHPVFRQTTVFMPARGSEGGKGRVERATLGGGCFWCLEAVFEMLRGVESVVSGYAGGHVKNPSYREVCGKRTGHAEVVQVTYDPGVISFRDLLDIFFTIHDPTTVDRQGHDVGPQYRSIILPHDTGQEEEAREAIRAWQESGTWGDGPIVTEVKPLEAFYPAEGEHQGYYRANPNQPYCRAVVAPKVARARTHFLEKLRA
jgi:peptide-methionine (S)-S-oxide reductase